jgi:vitamin K-dependent gamma-carboxylase-like protein
VGGVRERWATAWEGTVSPWPLAVFRTGLALLILVRTTDLLRPWVDLDHHQWVHGLEYLPSIEAISPPALHSPLIPFFPPIGTAAATLLVWARTLLAVVLLLGIRPRLTAGLLGLAGAGLVCADRYRYLHHLYLLWVSCGWLAFAPSAERLSVERLFRSGLARVPRWSLQLLRAQLLVAYAAAGLAKLRLSWLSGRTLVSMARAGLVGGPLWTRLLGVSGARPIALTIVVTELLLVPLLAWRRTRVAGVLVGLCLHAAMSSMMMLSTFGAQMALLLLLFLPWAETGARPPGDHQKPSGQGSPLPDSSSPRSSSGAHMLQSSYSQTQSMTSSGPGSS